MEKVNSFAISFWINNKKSNQQGSPVYCRITVDQQRAEISTQQYVNPKNWHNGRIIARTQQEKEINQFLANYQSMVNRHYHQMTELQLPVTAELLKNRVLGKTERKATFLEMFDLMMVNTKELVDQGKMAQATLDKIKYAKDKLISFMKKEKKASDILLDSIKVDFVHDFYHFLRTKHNLENNSAMKYIKISRQVLTFAKSKGKLTMNPFSDFVCTYIEPDIEVLEMHEIITLWETPMPGLELEEIRDIYLFCVFTGFAYKDSMSLDPDNIFLGINREKFITKDRSKTDVRQMVMLLDIPLQIIEKYKNHKCRMIKSKLLPQHHNSHFNKYIKVIASLCGIKKHLTHHTARHTFATTVTLENDVPLETVGKMLGHKSIKSTMRYAKVTRKKIHNNMLELRDKLNPVLKIDSKQKFIG